MKVAVMNEVPILKDGKITEVQYTLLDDPRIHWTPIGSNGQICSMSFEELSKPLLTKFHDEPIDYIIQHDRFAMAEEKYMPGLCNVEREIKKLHLFDNSKFLLKELEIRQKATADWHRQAYGITFKDPVMKEVLFCAPDAEIKIVDRWKNSEKQECVSIQFEDKFGMTRTDCVYSADINDRRVNRTVFDGERGMR